MLVMKLELKQDFLYTPAVNKALNWLFILTPFKTLRSQHVKLQPSANRIQYLIINLKYDQKYKNEI